MARLHRTTQHEPRTLIAALVELESNMSSFVLARGLTWLGLVGLLALAVTAHSHVVHAQSCHMPALRAPEGTSWQASATGIFATYTNASYSGEYQGVSAKAAYLHPRLSLDVSLPYYRIVRNGLSQHGVGDLGADARVVALRSADQRLSAGPELALTVPTGSAAHDLGMGHVMLMPGVWLKLQQDRLLVVVQAAYGRAPMNLHTKGHHHEAIFPLVNPMNMQELEHAIAIGYALHEHLELEARLFGAVPVASPTGTTRELLAGGAHASIGIVELGAEVQVPLVGAIFHAKTLLTAAARW